MRYEVEYEQTVVIRYRAIVEANSSKEAKQRVVDMEIISEEETDFQEKEIKVKRARKEQSGK